LNGHPAPSAPALEELPPDLDDEAILEATAALDIDDDIDVGEIGVPENEAPETDAPAVPVAEAAQGPMGESAIRETHVAEFAVRERVRTTHEAPRVHEPSPRLEPQRHEPPRRIEPPPRHEPPHRTEPPPRHESPEPGADAFNCGATAPQLRRFIKSRAYVPMHELRRRFAMNGGEDDVTPIDVDQGRIYVGLPFREGSLLGELLRAGDIGYELSMDPIAPIVVGVYPMRPVPRS
jgi:hypothetical protein